MNADIGQGFLSIAAPLGRTLMGKQKGDTTDLTIPAGKRAYKILDVMYQSVNKS